MFHLCSDSDQFNAFLVALAIVDLHV
jgi:hypothetical protein